MLIQLLVLVDLIQFHLGSSDSASDIVIFNSSSGMDIIKQFNAGSSNGDILKYTGNLNDQESSANTTNGSDGTDDLNKW